MSDMLCSCDERCKKIHQEDCQVVITCTDYLPGGRLSKIIKGCGKQWVIQIREWRSDANQRL